MKLSIFILLILSALVGRGQAKESKIVYDTIPSWLQISDTTEALAIVKSYKGFVVYRNETWPLKDSTFPFQVFMQEPQKWQYLRNDKKPLPEIYIVWANRDARDCILQPMRGM